MKNKINHLQINVKAYPLAAQYADDVCARVEDLRVNTAPFEETIEKVNLAIDNIDKETDLLYNRIADLEVQRAELIDVGNEAATSRDNIVEKHKNSLAEANNIFFTKMAKLVKVDALADLDNSWSVDLHYVDSFGIMYICQEIPATTSNEDGGDLDEGLSTWMDDINN